MQSENDTIQSALLKRAKGYWVEEEVTEFVYVYNDKRSGEDCKELVGYIDDVGTERINKRKVTKHYVPPDIAALKLLLEQSKDDVHDMTEEEMIKERDRLIKELQELQDRGNK